MNKFQSAGYFHARDLGCLRNLEELEEVEVDDCYMTNETLKKLKKDILIYSRQGNYGTTCVQQEIMF